MRCLTLALVLLATVPASAQSPTASERAQGYAEADGQTVFVFDPALYGVTQSASR